jgi:hypothetical protein
MCRILEINIPLCILDAWLQMCVMYSPREAAMCIVKHVNSRNPAISILSLEVRMSIFPKLYCFVGISHSLHASCLVIGRLC